MRYRIGSSRDEDSITSGGLVQGRFGTSTGRKTVYFSLVSPLDPKYKPCHHRKYKHDRLFVAFHMTRDNCNLDCCEQSPAPRRAAKKTKEAKSMLNVTIVPDGRQLGNISQAHAGDKLGGWKAFPEKNTRMTIVKCCKKQIRNSFCTIWYYRS